MHGSDTLQRQIVVHHREHTLLHLAAVPCIDYNLLTACYIEYYSSLGIKSKLLIVFYLCLGCIVDNEIRFKVFQFLVGRNNEHVLYKMCLPCHFHNESDGHACILVSTTEGIYNIELLITQFVDCNFLNCFPGLNACRMVIILVFIGCPPYSVLGVFVHDNKFVFRGTSCVNTCHYIYCTQFTDLAFVEPFQICFCFFFKQILVGRIVHNLCSSRNTILA